MNCDDLEGLWNDVLDKRSTGSADLEDQLEAHVASCPSCRTISSRYQVLRQAMTVLTPPPDPSSESTARLLALLTAPPRPNRGRISGRLGRKVWISMVSVAAAAALVFLVWPGGSRERSRVVEPSWVARVVGPVVPPRPLQSALDEARVASIELAREASATVSRIGHDMLDEAPGEAASRSDRTGLERDLAEAPSNLISSVGDRFQERVRATSGSARYAFGFLLGPPTRRHAQKSL